MTLTVVVIVNSAVSFLSMVLGTPVKPVDTATLTAAAVGHPGPTGGRGGTSIPGRLGLTVVVALTDVGRTELALAYLGVRQMSGSGTSQELLDATGIGASHIAEAARSRRNE